MIITFFLSIKLTIPSHLFLLQAMIPLIRIINSVIRRFGRAHAKNPALVVEILFQHSHIQKHILSIDNVYEATNYFHGKSQGVSDFNCFLSMYIFLRISTISCQKKIYHLMVKYNLPDFCESSVYLVSFLMIFKINFSH